MSGNNGDSQKTGKGKNPNLRSILYIVIASVLAYVFFSWKHTQEITWSAFKNKMLMKGYVERVEVVNNDYVEVYIKSDSLKNIKEYRKGVNFTATNSSPQFSFRIGSVEVFEQRIEHLQSSTPEDKKVVISYSKKENIVFVLLTWLFPLLMLLLAFRFFRRMRGGIPGSTSIFDFAKARGTEYEVGKRSSVTFADVAGYDEAKAEVKEVVDFLTNPSNFTKLGAKIPKGVLLIGPPGSGKTLLAKAVAGEAAVPFFSISGSEFIEMFVGVGASRVRGLFDKAKQKAPSIIFIDEIDTIGRTRGRAASIQVNDERDSTLNQLLTEMDGFEPNTGVIVIAATNRADVLDSALLRAGRFDRHIHLELPNKTEREAIFGVHLKPLLLDKYIDKKILAGQTPGFSGADIANVCNEAALIAARSKKDKVDMSDFSNAIDRIVAGLEKKSKIISPKERRIIAYHEAGHVIVGWVLQSIDPLIKVSIIPRGKSLGSSWYLPEENQIITRKQYKDKMCAVLGGRVAEEIVFEQPSSGALDDLEKVTKQAYMMVVNLGLSKKIGSVSFYDSTGVYQAALNRPYSEATAQIIDEEVRLLLNEAYECAKKILLQKRKQLDVLVEMLLNAETLYTQDIEKVLGPRQI